MPLQAKILPLSNVAFAWGISQFFRIHRCVCHPERWASLLIYMPGQWTCPVRWEHPLIWWWFLARLTFTPFPDPGLSLLHVAPGESPVNCLLALWSPSSPDSTLASRFPDSYPGINPASTKSCSAPHSSGQAPSMLTSHIRCRVHFVVTAVRNWTSVSLSDIWKQRAREDPTSEGKHK